MTDVVVTVPYPLFATWVQEGDAPGTTWSGHYSYFVLYGPQPTLLERGDRVYIVSHGKLRGYAPLAFITEHIPEDIPHYPGAWALVRKGQAQAVTIMDPEKGCPLHIRGFRSWRYRNWKRGDEVSFPTWDQP